MGYTTKPSIFEKMRSGDEISWEHFYKTYRALVILRGRDMGLADADLDELLSRVMLKFFQHSQTFRYDRSKGRFRDYFRMMVTNTALDILREKGGRKEVGIDSMDDGNAAQDNELDSKYEEEWRAHIFSQALQEARNSLPSRAVQAFIMNRLRNISVQEIAAMQSVGKSTVYNDCNLVWDFLTKTVKRMSEEY